MATAKLVTNIRTQAHIPNWRRMGCSSILSVISWPRSDQLYLFKSSGASVSASHAWRTSKLRHYPILDAKVQLMTRYGKVIAHITVSFDLERRPALRLVGTSSRPPHPSCNVRNRICHKSLLARGRPLRINSVAGFFPSLFRAPVHQ